MTSTPATPAIPAAVDIADVRRRHPIDDIVAAAGVELRSTGHGWMGCCPFHDDSTASLSVAGVPDRFHCFGCGASGDVIDFVGRLHGLGFRDAVAHLDNTTPSFTPGVAGGRMPSGRFPHAVPTGPESGRRADSQPTVDVIPERGYEINAFAWQWFSQPVAHRYAVSYLRNHRGIDLDRAELELGQDLVGHTGHGWTHLTDHLRSRGVTDDELVAMDLAQPTRHGRLIDTLRDRLIIPVTLPNGRISGFVGRDTSSHPRAPKYRNPTHTPTFDKKDCLYRPHHRTVPDAAVVVVEGPLDALAITAATAAPRYLQQLAPCSTLGTTVTPAQAIRVADLTSEPVVIALDGDQAGADGTLRWIDTLCRNAGRLALVSRLPDGLDPADWLARHSVAGLAAFHPAGAHTTASRNDGACSATATTSATSMTTAAWTDLKATSPHLPGRELAALACTFPDPVATLTADLQRLAPLLNRGANSNLIREASAEMARRGWTLTADAHGIRGGVDCGGPPPPQHQRDRDAPPQLHGPDLH